MGSFKEFKVVVLFNHTVNIPHKPDTGTITPKNKFQKYFRLDSPQFAGMGYIYTIIKTKMYTKKFKPNQLLKTTHCDLIVCDHFIDQLNNDDRRNEAPSIQSVKWPSDLKDLLNQSTYVPNDPSNPMYQQYYKVQLKYRTYKDRHIFIHPSKNLMFHVSNDHTTLITYFELSKRFSRTCETI